MATDSNNLDNYLKSQKSVSSINTEFILQLDVPNIPLLKLEDSMDESCQQEEYTVSNDEPISPLVNKRYYRYKEHWNTAKFDKAFDTTQKMDKKESDLGTDPSLRESNV